MSNLNRLYQRKIPGLIKEVQGSNQSAINRHMSNLMSGQKSQLDNYVKRAAGAGIQRGGMNVAGARPLESSLALQATKGLASQYGANYGQAVNYANADRASSRQLLSQLMSGADSSGGYNQWSPGPTPRTHSNRSLSSSELQARSRAQAQQALDQKRARQDAFHDRRMARLQEEQASLKSRQDRDWELKQRQQQEAQFNQQQLQNQRENNRQIRGRAQERAAYRQQLQDEEDARTQRQREQQRADSAYRQSRMTQRQALQAMNASSGASTFGKTIGGPRRSTAQSQGQMQSTGYKTLDDFQQKYQKQKMMNELAQMAQQTKQTKLQTQQQELQLSGDQYKQNAWRRAQNPYIQSMNAFLGLGGLGYGGMNNARLGQARIAADVWAGLTRPSNRSFSWSNSTSVSGPRNSYKY